jgi:hypothetical protein
LAARIHIGSTRSGRSLGSGCLALFALPFAAVGVFMAGLVLWSALDHLAMRSWRETPCTILSAELETNPGDDGGSTHRVTARYRYVVDEKPYENSRVGLHTGADNIGSFHQDAYRQLKHHQETGEPFRGWVNPRDPADAILYRDARWEMLAFQSIFGAVFGGVGFGLLAWALISRRKTAARKQAVAAHPGEPWLWNAEWAAGRITCSGKTLMFFLAGFALFWNLMSAPLLFILPGEIFEKGNTAAWFGMVFPAVGLGLIVAAAWAVLRWRKYGESIFQMASVPGVLGGSLAGVIRTSKPIEPDEGFRLVLRCIQQRTSGSGKNRSTTETTLWQDEQVVRRGLESPGAESSAVPVLFAVPYDQPPSSAEEENPKIIWRLEARASVPGIDYRATFDVPVFKTKESRPDFELDRSAVADYLAETDPADALRRSGVLCMEAPNGWGDRYVFPMFRHVAVIAGLGAFLAVWLGAIAAMWHLQAPILFPIVFGLFALLMIAGLADLMFYRSVVDVGRDGLRVRGGLFGLGRTHYFAADDLGGFGTNLDDFDARQDLQAGSRLYFSVVARCSGGRTVTLGKRLPDKRTAQAVIERMRASLGGGM